MAKDGMTNVDVAAAARELSALLVGARLEKAYQPAKEQVLLRMRRKGIGRVDLLVELGRYVVATSRAPDNPDKPSMVAQVIRNDYGNARVKAITQIGFDRLIRIDLERGDGDRAIVIELFGDGNLLLLDKDATITLPMRGAEHGARRLKRGEAYQPPPGGAEPFAMDVQTLQETAAKASRDIVRFLALDLGFGPLWAEELCLRAGIRKNLGVAEVEPPAWARLHEVLAELGGSIARNDLAPGLVYEDGTLVDAVPFPMQKYPAPRYQLEETPTFREALDARFRGFSGGDEGQDEDPRQRRLDEARARVERQIEQMQEAISGFEHEEARRKTDADLLYTRFQDVERILADLQKARETRSWQHIAAVLESARAAGDDAARQVVELRPHDATAVLRLEDLDGASHDVAVDVRKSVQENADDLYEAAKRARGRREGAAKALAEAEARLRDIDAKGLDGFGAAPKRQAGPSRHFWFETYRWTLTPNGLLAVGGRNAGQNDAVVKKYLRDGDRYVHAEVHGAPSVVVRPADGSVAEEVSDEDLRAAGQFAACSSRAWRQFGQASAYWVTPQQVSKTPRSGEFVPRGAWIVHGRRNSLDKLPMAWAVGRARFTKGGVPIPQASDEEGVEKLAGGPPDAIAAWCTEVVHVAPGETDPNDAAAWLAEHFGVDMEDAQAVLPAGPVRIQEAA